jgi:hypothetical protein
MRWLFLLLLVLLGNTAAAQPKDSITVELNKTSFVPGDSIGMEISLHNYTTVARTASIQLWIENIKTGRRWKYRYPLVNGYLAATLAIDSSLPSGVYALNFLLQKTFFKLTGTVKNRYKKDKEINYVMISKNKQMMMGAVPISETDQFTVKNLLFQDSAFIIFSRVKQKRNDLLIDIETSLDSAFVPSAIHTQLIRIGNEENLQPLTAAYAFTADNTVYKIILPEVVIKTRSTKRLEDFQNENVSGAFTAGDAIVLDGLGSDEMANAPDFYTYLTTKVGGLRIVIDNENGNRSLVWRNQPVEMFINEIRLEPDLPFLINPSDIALIKIFRPGTQVASDASAGGAIAVYTKTGDYNKAGNRSYSFYITGYTGLEARWQ